MDKHSIGKTISALRKSKGWTQVELAEQLNISDKTVSKWESEAGYPELTMFPLIADLFGVSIDYLMTGKEMPAEIITMSKAELCAKNDDISMLDQIDQNHIDESGHNLAYYVSKYESINVYNQCNDLKMDLITNIKMALIANNISRLERYHIKQLAHVDDKKRITGPNTPVATLPEDIFHLIISDKRISKSTFLYLLSPCEKDSPHKKSNIWYNGIPYLIDECIRYGTSEQFDLLMQATEKNNNFAFENLDHDEVVYGRYNQVKINQGQQMYGVVVILEKTFRFAIERGDISTVEKLNKINRQPFPLAPRFYADEDILRMMKLRADKSISHSELIVQSSIHKGIINVDELLAVNDIKAITKALSEYPISKYEQLAAIVGNMRKASDSDDWRCIFEYAVDNNDALLAKYVMNNDKRNIDRLLFDKEILPPRFAGTTVTNFFEQTENANPNIKYLVLRSKTRFSGVINSSRHIDKACRQKDSHIIQTLDDLAEYIKLCKEQIIDDWKVRMNKNKIIEELNEEFFRSELAKGNLELVAVKLCVRLEAILKSTYHYDGDFSEMLDKYCVQYGTTEVDDGWGYIERQTNQFVDYLRKLRKYRNDIVHSEKKAESMTPEELDFCIKYICGLK